MNKQQLFENIKKKQSFLCVGLDTDIKKIPQHLLSEEDPIFAFNKAIIDATADYCVAYKPNLAFYESLGTKGMMAFETFGYYRNALLDEMDKRGLKQMLHTKVLEFTAEGVVAISEIPPRCMPVLSSIISR